jgi:hypothetical protein
VRHNPLIQLLYLGFQIFNRNPHSQLCQPLCCFLISITARFMI